MEKPGRVRVPRRRKRSVEAPRLASATTKVTASPRTTRATTVWSHPSSFWVPTPSGDPPDRAIDRSGPPAGTSPEGWRPVVGVGPVVAGAVVSGAEVVGAVVTGPVV